MKRVLVTPPAYYPLVLDQVKSHLNIDYTNDDKYLQALISVATSNAEQFLRRRLITQTWKLFLDAWPYGDSILLPFGKLQSVTHVKYTDTAGDQTTWYDADTTTYADIDTDRELGRIQLAYGYSWPTASLHPQNPIEIQFVCGYGANAVQAITGASSASPIAITIGTHGHTTGDEVYVYDVGGNTAANGGWIITKSTADIFTLNGSAYNAAYTSGGSCIKQSVPLAIIQAMLLMIGDMHENREDILVGQTSVNLRAAESLLMPYRIHEQADG